MNKENCTYRQQIITNIRFPNFKDVKQLNPSLDL